MQSLTYYLLGHSAVLYNIWTLRLAGWLRTVIPNPPAADEGSGVEALLSLWDPSQSCLAGRPLRQRRTDSK